MKGCLEGDEQAWAQLIERYSRLIFTIPLNFGFTQPLAEEIFQEVCLVMLEGLGALRERERVRAWIVTVTRRLCIQQMRREQKRRASLGAMLTESEASGEISGAVDTSPMRTILQQEQRTLVWYAVANLDPKCRVILTQLFLQDPQSTYQELASDLNIPIGSIGPMRARCLDKLRRELAQIEGEPEEWLSL